MNRIQSWFHSLALMSLFLLALCLPFEMEIPLLNLGLFRMTNVEAILAVAMGLTLLAYLQGRLRQQHASTSTAQALVWLKPPRSWLWLWAFFAVALVLAGLFAPEFRLNALKAAARTLSGVALALVTLQLVRNQQHLAWLALGLVLGGLASAVIGMIELWRDVPFSWLSPFRVAPTVAGPFMRLTGSFNHANQTAMFIEATLPLLITLTWLAGRNGYLSAALRACPERRQVTTLTAAGTLAVLLYLEAGFLTYSRASFVTIWLSSILVASLLIWRRPRSQHKYAYPWLAVAGVVSLFFVLNAWLDPVFQLRLSSEGDDAWYQADLQAPDRLSVTAGETVTTTVRATNKGALTWTSRAEKAIQLGGRWYREDDDRRLSNEFRWSLGREVAPGQVITVTVPVTAPHSPGQYRLEWDLVQEQVVWFSQKSESQTSTGVTVLAAPRELTARPETFVEAKPPAPPIPHRRVLWAVAGQQLLERPALGIGLDNFRLTYGRYLDWPRWNDTIHTNNWYIEMLVSLGLLGSLPFFTWLVLVAINVMVTLRRPAVTMWQVALAFALFAYLIHGLLDYFLLFNGTGLLFWLLIGFWLSQQSPRAQETL